MDIGSPATVPRFSGSVAAGMLPVAAIMMSRAIVTIMACETRVRMAGATAVLAALHSGVDPGNSTQQYGMTKMIHMQGWDGGYWLSRRSSASTKINGSGVAIGCDGSGNAVGCGFHDDSGDSGNSGDIAAQNSRGNGMGDCCTCGSYSGYGPGRFFM